MLGRLIRFMREMLNVRFIDSDIQNKTGGVQYSEYTGN